MFDKYDRKGAYHWESCNPRSSIYSPSGEARYQLAARAVRGARTVLDLGCGDGFLVSLMAPESELVVGVDPEHGGVSLAAGKLGDRPGWALVVGDGFGLPFADDSFDAVVMVDVVEHLETPDQALVESRRVLKPGGRMVITTPRRLPDHWWDEKYHVKEYASEELRAMMVEHFERVAMTHFVSLRWWLVRKRLGKTFMRLWSRFIFNPFTGTGDDPERFGHLLATGWKGLSEE